MTRQRKSGLHRLVASNLERTRRRNEAAAAALAEGYLREHADELDPDHEHAAQVEQLGAQALGALLERRAQDLTAGFAAAQEQEGTTT